MFDSLITELITHVLAILSVGFFLVKDINLWKGLVVGYLSYFFILFFFEISEVIFIKIDSLVII